MKRLLFFLFIGTLTAFAPTQTEVEEYNLKAAFIYNFSKYIDWGPYQRSDFTIGVLGNSPIVRPLAEIARTKTINGKKIVIQQFSRPADITYCNVLFISNKGTYVLSSYISKLPQGMLTIAEDAGMAEEGAAFNFILSESKLKFEANLKAVTATHLKVSSELLQHAIIVEQ